MNSKGECVITKDWREHLLAKAKEYAEATGMKIGSLGNRIVKDGDFFKNIESGSNCNVDTLLRVEQWFFDHPLPPKTKRQSGTS